MLCFGVTLEKTHLIVDNSL